MQVIFFFVFTFSVNFCNAATVTVTGKKSRVHPSAADEAPAHAKLQKFIHPFSLHKLHHQLRNETAPYTDEYYKYLKNKNYIPNT